MAVYSFSALSDGRAISFDPNSDVLHFDQTSISAADLAVAAEGSDVRIVAAGKSVLLQSASLLELASSNVSFANGSALLFGDNSPGTANDNAANSLSGTSGNDLLQGFGGADTLNGGAGDDHYLVGAGDVLVDSGGIDTVVSDVNWALGAGFENLTLIGSANINGAGNDLANLIIQNDGNNVTWAGRGNDTVLGGAGNDYLGGDAGNDWLDGQSGNDTLDGGGDKDHFAFSLYGAANADTAVAFASNWDDIQLDIATFGALRTNGQFSSTDARFYAAAGATAGHDADDRIVYNTSTGQLFYDADGSGSGAAQIIGTFQGAPTLRATDIHVYGTPTSSGSTINGTSGDDTLVGTSGDDTIDGVQGNDDLSGGGGDDYLFGDFGDDRLDGGDGNDTLTGFRGADTLFGGGGDDQLFANNGFGPDEGADDLAADLLLGGDGNDTLMGNAGETLDGGAGDDSLIGGSGADYLIGGDGNDVLMGGNDDGSDGGDTLSGGLGNDTLTGGADGLEDDFLFDVTPGQANADVITDFTIQSNFVEPDKIVLDGVVFTAAGATGSFLTGDGRFYAAPGASTGHDADDRVVYDTSTGNLWYDADGSGVGAAQLIATVQGAPTLSAPYIAVINGSGPVIGTEGDDVIHGTDGNDTIDARGGNDSVFSGGGDDSILGGTGDDLLDGGDGRDTVLGGAGNDRVIGGYDADLLDGGDGNDTLESTSAGNPEREASDIDTLQGGAGDDSLIGSDGGGHDLLLGGEGFDTVHGLGGDDTLAGGGGVDSLWGGAGADQFILDQLGIADADGINDFETGIDQLILDGSVLTAIGASGQFAPDDVRFYAAAGATSGHDASDRIIYDTSGLHLWYDPDGSGPAASQLIGAFTSGIDIAAPDFIVINGTSSGAINGTEGDDTLVGTPGDDTINGLDGNDSISGLEGDDSLSGGDGNDTLAGGPGTDTLDGGFGDDVYVDPAGDVLIDAGGTDTVIGFETSPFLPAGFENLILRGGPFVIGNEDFASSGQGNELDNLIVNERSDPTGLYGEGGNDTLIGSAAADYFVYVGSSDFGHDSVDGGGGFNTFVFEALDTPVTVDFGTGTVTSALGSVSFADVQQALGTSGNDSMVGGDSAVRLFGEDGSDTLVGGAGNDFLDAADYYSGYWSATTGNDSLLGGGGDDTLIGGVGNDFIDGGAGNDQLEAGTFWVDDVGDDTLTGGSGNDTISGGGGADRFVFDQTPGTANADHLTDFASSDDQIHLDATVMTQLGASGAFAVGDARFYAAAGASAGHDADDRVVYDTGSGNLWYDADGSGATAALLIATLDGPAALAATDIVVLNGTTPPSGPIDGTSGDDSLVGTAGDDTINGLEGNDTLMGFGGNDVLDGGPGTDSMDGGAGNDSYYVTAGDVLTDASGVDTVLSDGDWSLGLDFENITLLGTGNWDVQGFNADNLAIGNAGDNYFNMRDGNDTILAGAGDDSIDMSTGGTSSYGNDSIDGGDGTDTVDFAGYARSGVMVNVALGTIAGGGDAGAGSATIANVERVIGGDFNDSFTGDSQGNQFDGRAGDDSLAGGAGNDLLTGGAGADSFLFADVGTANADSVSDFTTGSDEIHLDADAMAALGTSGQFSSADARFYEASGASSGHDADDRVIYDTASGNLWYDADGSGAGSALLIATLQGSASLAATDIFVENGSAPPPPPPSGSIDGTSANDSLVGTTGDDTINGLEGNDTLRGLDGNDVLDGGPGTDLLDGGAGNDTYYVTAGDTLTDSGGVDTVLSGVNWSLGAGFENLTLTGSADLRSGGNDLANLITQNSGDNVTWAGRGDDTILGADGNDYLGGDANNDWLDGQAGNDTLDGGGDRDHFVFSSYGPADADVVRSFATAWDDLEFDASAFSALGAPGDFGSGDARFYAASGASSGHDAADRLIYDTSTGRLYYDDDGSGSHAAQLVATLEGAPSLAASDISVV